MKPTDRTRIRRLPERGEYDRAVIDTILDAALICHAAWVTEDGTPRVVPTIHARDGDTLYLHGSPASRTLRALQEGAEVCIAATIVDGLVLARSAINHSMNYRSVIVYGTAREVTDREEQLHASRVLTDHVVPGRSADIREPNDDELRQTLILAVPLDEASAKIATGPPEDEEEDYELPIWAGVLPLSTVAGEPENDPRLLAGLAPPANVESYPRPGGV